MSRCEIFDPCFSLKGGGVSCCITSVKTVFRVNTFQGYTHFQKDVHRPLLVQIWLRA